MRNSIFFDSMMLCGTSSIGNDLIYQKNALWQADKKFPHQRLFWGRWCTTPGGKLDGPGDLKRYIETVRSQAATWELIGL